MPTATPVARAPTTFQEAAAALAQASERGAAVRICGGQTKIAWGRDVPESAVRLHTTSLDEIVEHNAGDLTATLQAGVPLARAQEVFAEAGQMLALDPPLGDPDPAATIGGIVATGDSGPLRHRYGGPRDLVVGATVAFSDGTVARTGGKVIKNVAGYDLAKLLCGSFGTLGAILSVNVRLHPRHPVRVTAIGTADQAAVAAAAAAALAAAPLEFEALDLGWDGASARVLARCAGPEAPARARRAVRLLAEHGLTDADTIDDDDEPLWAAQRAAQRSAQRAVVRIGHRPGLLAAVIDAVRAGGGTLVARAARGLSFVTIDADALGRLRAALPAGCRPVLLDAPAALRADPWGHADDSVLELMRRVKARFDPAGTCNPGIYVGGI